MSGDPHHANFDVVLAIGEKSIKDILSLYFRFGKMTSRFAETDREIAAGNGQTAKISYDLALTEPEIELRPFNSDRARVDTRIRGTLTLKAGPLDVIQRSVDVFIRLTLDVPLVATNSGNEAVLVFQISQAIVSRSIVQLRQPGTKQRDLIVSAFVGEPQIDEQVSELLGEIGDIPLDLPLGDLGLPAEVGIFSMVTAVRDRTLLVAANLILEEGETPIGTLQELHNFTSIFDMAVVAHPRVLEKLFRDLTESTKAEMQENVDRLRYNPETKKLISDITLDSIHFDLRERHVKFWGKARKHGITIDDITFDEATRTETVHATDSIDFTGDFSFKLALKTTTVWNEYVTPHVEAVAYDVSVHLPPAENTVVNVFSWGLFPLLGWLGPTIRGGLRKAKGLTFQTLDRKLDRFDRPGVWNLPIKDDVRLTAVTKRSSLGETGAEFYYRLNGPRPQMGVGVDNSLLLRPHVSENFTAKWVIVADPGFANPDDPELLVLWTATRSDPDESRAGAEIETTLTDEEFPFSAMDQGRLDVPIEVSAGALRVTGWARIVRRLDNGEDVVLGEYKAAIETKDKLDRSRPYVRWEHDVWRLRWRTAEGSSGQVRYQAGWKIHRKSKLHRTNFPGRCRFADQFSKDDTLELIYSDRLPVPRERLTEPRVRKILCDYCFFGGPDKDEPLV